MFAALLPSAAEIRQIGAFIRCLTNSAALAAAQRLVALLPRCEWALGDLMRGLDYVAATTGSAEEREEADWAAKRLDNHGSVGAGGLPGAMGRVHPGVAA